MTTMVTRLPYPNIGPKKPLTELEQQMDVDYVEDTCGWCGVHLMWPSEPMWEGQLICLNACNMSVGATRRFEGMLADSRYRAGADRTTHHDDGGAA